MARGSSKVGHWSSIYRAEQARVLHALREPEVISTSVANLKYLNWDEIQI